MGLSPWHGVTSGVLDSVFISKISHRVACISCFHQITMNSTNNFFANSLNDIYIFTMTFSTRSPLSSLTLPAMPNASGMLSSPS